MEELSDKIEDGGITAQGKLGASEWNQPMKELENAITNDGQALSAGDLEQLTKKLVKIGQGAAAYGTDTGAANAYVVSNSNSVKSNGLFDGMVIRFRPANDSTSSSVTINAFGTGAKSLYRQNGTDLVPGDISTLEDVVARYDTGSGGRWLLASKLVTQVAADAGPVNGFHVENISTTQATIGAGSCLDSTGTVLINFSGSMTKATGTPWVAGDTNNGRASGTIWTGYDSRALFVIMSDAGDIDFGWDASAVAANLLADTGYTYYRRIAWTVLASGGVLNVNLINLPNDPDEWVLHRPDRIYSSAPQDYSGGLSVSIFERVAPPESMLYYRLIWEPGVAGQRFRVGGADQGAAYAVIDSTHYDLEDRGSETILRLDGRTRLDASSALIFETDTTDISTVEVIALGWRDSRRA